MSSPEDTSTYLDPSTYSKSLPRSFSHSMDKSRSRSYLKDISIDEGDALKKISEEVNGNLGGEVSSSFVIRRKRNC